MVTLMLAEKNNDLLIKNHKSRHTGAKIFPKVNYARKVKRIGIVVVYSIINLEKLTTPNGEDLTNRLDLNNIPRVKRPKWIKPRSVWLYVTYVDLKNMCLENVVFLHICVSQMKSPQNIKRKKWTSQKNLKRNCALNLLTSQMSWTKPLLRRTEMLVVWLLNSLQYCHV